MKIICSFGIRHNVYKPDPEKHVGSQKPCVRNFQEEKKQVENYYAEIRRIQELEAMRDVLKRQGCYSEHSY